MPLYFSKLPKTFYNNVLLTDIVSRVAMIEEYLNNMDLYYEYLIQDGDTPEIIAEKYYGVSEYHWIIMMTNNIFNATFDFPMGYETFNNYIEDKYKDLGKESPKSLRILDAGSNYTNGTYEGVPLVITNPNELTKLGTELSAKIIISSNRVTSISVYNGDGYDANTRLTVDSSQLSTTGNVCSFSINSFMNGYEYSKLHTDPLLGYNNSIIAYDPISLQKISEETYTVGKESYLLLAPTSKIINFPDGSSIGYNSNKYIKSIYDIELDKNEEKRLIKILKEEYVHYVVKQFNTIMGSL
jgi:hypothetical protein